MALIVSLIKSYAGTVFESGARKFSEVRPEYVDAVKIYAATGEIDGVLSSPTFTGYTDAKIQDALNNGWITQQEYEEVMALKYPEPTE